MESNPLQISSILTGSANLSPKSFDHGYYLLVKSIQELRDKKDGLVTIGIGGPSGSGKTSLTEKVSSVIPCTVISMENYCIEIDDKNDPNSIDFDALIKNLQDLSNGKDTLTPLFDFNEKRRVSLDVIKSASSGVVILDGTYALNARLRSWLDIKVAVVGGVHFSLLSKVQYDIGDSCSLDYLIDSIFPLFRKHIEPDLHHAQIRINNSFASSFREPIYKLKCKSMMSNGQPLFYINGNEAQTDNFIEMYLRPPLANEEARINDWIKVRQSGIRYYLSLGDQRIVDKNYIIRPKAEFEVGRMTLGGLLALGYNVVISYKRSSVSVVIGNTSISLETIDSLGETFLVLRGISRKVVGTEAAKKGITGPWITKSYLELILEQQGGPSGSGKTSMARKMADIVGCEVVSLENYYRSELIKEFKYDDFRSLDITLLFKNINGVRNKLRTNVPIFDFESGCRAGFRDLEVSEDCGVVIFEGVYALHSEIRNSLDLWIAVVGGVHSHLISRVQRDKIKLGGFLSQNEIIMAVFPVFHQQIEPHLVHAHLKVRNDFDPVYSPESSLFVLKSNKQVAYDDILKILDQPKLCTTVQNFIDMYFKLPGTPQNGHLSESDCIRVRLCEGRFALLIREPIKEGSFIIQPKVDFDISITTVAGLLNLGYQIVAYIEASAYIYQDGKIVVEVDNIQDIPSSYIQIKGADKQSVGSAGSKLKLDGSYTTQSYLEIILERSPFVERSTIQNRQTSRLQELVEFIQTQGNNSVSDSSQGIEASPIASLVEDLQIRVRKLEKWNTINTVLWMFVMSAIMGYSLYRRAK